MTKIKDVTKYPDIHVFFNDGTVQRLHLIKSNGIAMLCCTDTGDVNLYKFTSIRRVSPQNNEYFTCRYDDTTGTIIARNTKTSFITKMGPVRGQPDPDIDLKHIAYELGLDHVAIWNKDDIAEGKNIKTYSAVPQDELEKVASEPTYKELTKHDESFSLVDSVEVPDFADLGIDSSLLSIELPDVKPCPRDKDI